MAEQNMCRMTQLRLRYGISQADLANAAGVSRQLISLIELDTASQSKGHEALIRRAFSAVIASRRAALDGLPRGYFRCPRRTTSMDSETYYIPVNYTDAGKLFGLFEIRNAIESVVLGLPVLGLCTALLPFTITWKIIVTLCLLVPTVGFALIGLKDDSLTRYLKTWWTWRRRRRVLTYRGEVNAHEFEKRYLRWFRHGNQ